MHGRKPPELSPWEYVWRLTYAPDALESLPRVHPHDVREALQLALAAEHRAENFYSDTATHARDAMVRSCAKELRGDQGIACASWSTLSRARNAWIGSACARRRANPSRAGFRSSSKSHPGVSLRLAAREGRGA